jgi:replicative DNA helicase
MTPPAPQSLEAERELIGTLLCFYRPQLVHIAQATGLTSRDFYYDAHAIVYRAILRLHATEQHVDTLTVTRFLAAQPHETGSWLAVIGGAAQVEFLASFHVTHGFKERAAIVHEDGRWRRWLSALREAQESVHDRNSKRFWAAIARVREDVLPGELRVIEGGERAA